MEKMDIIKKAEELIRPEILYGTVSSSGKKWIFKSYMETEMINNIKETATPERIADYVKTGLISKIIPNRYINEMYEIINSPDFIEEIQISATETRNIKEALLEYTDKIEQDGKIQIGPNKKTINEIYQMLLRDRYVEPSYEDKIELCEDMYGYISGIQNDIIQNAISLEIDAPKFGTTTFMEYVTHYIPTVMIDISTVEINGKKHNIEEYLETVLKRQMCRYLTTIIKQEILDSMLDKGNGRKVRTQTYIEEELPKFMNTFTTFKFGPNEIGIQETIDQIVKSQEEVLKKEAERDLRNQVEQNNNKGEPLLVPTINLSMEDGKESITAEIPVREIDGVRQELPKILTSSERNVLASSEEVTTSDDEYYNTEFNNINDAIRNCKTEKELDALEKKVNDLISGSYQTKLSQTTEANAEYALDQIKFKRNILIILGNNIEDYQSIIKKVLLEIKLKVEANEIQTSEELAYFENSIKDIEKEMIAKNIDNRELDVLVTQIKRKLTIAGKTIGMLEKQTIKEETHNSLI